MEEKIAELRVALVIVDPLIPKLNRKLDSHKDAEVRRGLEPLIGMAHRTGCSIVGIVHHNKSSTSDPLNAVMGSKAFTATVRAVMSVLVEDGTRYLCLPKHNLGKEQPSIMNAKGFSPESVGALVEVALPGVRVSDWKLRKAYEKAAEVWFRQEPDQFVQKVVEGDLPSREEASAFSTLLSPRDPRARLFAIEALAHFLRVEKDRAMAEIEEEGRRPAETVEAHQ